MSPQRLGGHTVRIAAVYLDFGISITTDGIPDRFEVACVSDVPASPSTQIAIVVDLPNHVGVESATDHHQEQASVCPARIHLLKPSLGNRPADPLGIARQTEVLRQKIRGTGGQERYGDPRLGPVCQFGRRAIATGANQSDTWGQTGIALKDGFYAPIRGWDKKLIGMALEELKIHVPRIGEAPVREGCKLKHLLKIMANPSYHGYAVAISNEILLDCLESFPHTLANVKIAGPLSKNIALVNVSPLPPVELRERITAMLGRVEEIDEVRWIDGETKLKILANPGIYNSEEARYWIERGRLAPEFAFPVSFEWTRSTNRRLETFQVVDSWRL